jgi:hypothetical protein
MVLSDRAWVTNGPEPTPFAAWLAARFPRLHLLVVEGGGADLWQLRSLRGHMAVDTRTDLWRLVAYARVVIDLRPGSLIARECIESLRFATPIIVPSDTVAVELARSGGGLWYRDVAELLACTEEFADPEARHTFGARGKASADEYYGNPERFVARIGEALEVARSTSR